MRAAAILGANVVADYIRPFQVIAGAEIVIAGGINSPERFDAALIFGGDGTVHHQLAAAVEAQVPVLPVPMGSGNDFADALGIHHLANAITAWNDFCKSGARNVRIIDLGMITARNTERATRNFFCCVAGTGLDSEANRRANAMPRWLRARGGYVFGMLGALLRHRAQAVRVTVADADGGSHVIEEPATMVAFTNAPSYGRGMRIAPRARLDDGLLDVCFVRQASKLRLLRFFPLVYSGKHLEMPEVEYVQTPGLRVETEPPLDVYADGEFICRTPVEVTTLPRALRVIVPANSPLSVNS